MPWEPWPDMNEGQLYDVKRRDGDTLFASNINGESAFRIEAKKAETYEILKTCGRIVAAEPGSIAIPVRSTPTGWERWVE